MRRDLRRLAQHADLFGKVFIVTPHFALLMQCKMRSHHGIFHPHAYGGHTLIPQANELTESTCASSNCLTDGSSCQSPHQYTHLYKQFTPHKMLEVGEMRS